MSKGALFWIAGALLLAIAAPAHAQLNDGGGPISYSANNLEYFDAERRLVLTGDVDVVQGEARLRSDRLTMFFKAAPEAGAPAAAPAPDPAQPGGLGTGDIDRMVAEGEVYYVRPAQSARGDHAVYETATDSVVFTGNVVIASPDNVIRGNRLTMEIGSRRTTVLPDSGGRVRGVFVPQNGQGGAAAPPAGGG